MTTTPRPSVLDDQPLTIAPLRWTRPHAPPPTYRPKVQVFNLSYFTDFVKLLFYNHKYIYDPDATLDEDFFVVTSNPYDWAGPNEDRCNGSKRSRPTVMCGRYSCTKEFRSKKKLAKHRSEKCKAPQGWIRAKL